MRIPRPVIAFIVLVPLFVLFSAGITCNLLSRFFDALDVKCRDWFESIYHGPKQGR